MRNQRQNKPKTNVFNYTNDSFIRKDTNINFTPEFERHNLTKVLQENFYLKRLSSKIIFFLTADSPRNPKEISESAQKRIKKMMQSWKEGLEEGHDDGQELSHQQVLEVSEWLAQEYYSKIEEILWLEEDLGGAKRENQKFLRALELAKGAGQMRLEADEAFDAEFFQRKLDQVKAQTGASH